MTLLYFGSFNPPTLGHRYALAYAKDRVKPDRILIIPADHHVWGKELASFEDRVAMLKLAFSEPDIQISTIEHDQKLSGYTIDTLTALNLPARATILLGEDSANDFEKWKDYQKIQEQCDLLVVPRNVEHPTRIEETYSSTAVRHAIGNGKETVQLDPTVAKYIQSHHLYE